MKTSSGPSKRRAAGRVAIAVALALALVSGGAIGSIAAPAVAAASNSKTTSSTVSDRVILRHVLAVLGKNKSFGTSLCATHKQLPNCIGVTVTDGVATLTGEVVNVSEWDLIARLVGHVHGVKKVTNDTTTFDPGPHQYTTPTTTTTTTVVPTAAAGTTVSLEGEDLNCLSDGNSCQDLCNDAVYNPKPPTSVTVLVTLTPVQPGVKVTLTTTRFQVYYPAVLPFPDTDTNNPATSTQTVLAGFVHSGGQTSISFPVDGGPYGASFWGENIVASVSLPGGATSQSPNCEFEVNRPPPPPPSAYHMTLTCPPAMQGNPVTMSGTFSPPPAPGDTVQLYSQWSNSEYGASLIGEIDTPIILNSQGQFTATVDYPAAGSVVNGGTTFDTVTADVEYVPAEEFGVPQPQPGLVAAQSNSCVFSSV